MHIGAVKLIRFIQSNGKATVFFGSHNLNNEFTFNYFWITYLDNKMVAATKRSADGQTESGAKKVKFERNSQFKKPSGAKSDTRNPFNKSGR